MLLTCVLFAGTSGCSDPLGFDTNKQALDQATTNVRQNATKVLGLLRTSVGTRTLKDSLNEVLATVPSWAVTVLSSATGPADSFVADLACPAALPSTDHGVPTERTVTLNPDPPVHFVVSGGDVDAGAA